MFDIKKYRKQYYQKSKKKNKEYHNKWVQKNKEKVKGHRDKWVQKNNEYHNKWIQRNKEKIKEYQKQWYQKSKNRIRIRYKIYYQKNKEKILKQKREYAQKNKEKRKWYCQRNKERIAQQCKKYYQKNKKRCRMISKIFAIKKRIWLEKAGLLTLQTIQQVYEDNIKKYRTLTCYLCSKSIKFGKDCLEHKIPLSKGGTNEKKNLAIAHRSCNAKKYNKTEEEYRKEMKVYARK